MQGPKAAPRIVGALRRRLQPIRASTSSCSRAAGEASRISCRSATSGSCVRLRRTPSRSSPQWVTSRTRRSAISLPTPARRLRPLRCGWWFPMRPSCARSCRRSARGSSGHRGSASPATATSSPDTGSGWSGGARGRSSATEPRSCARASALTAAPGLLLERRRAALDTLGAALQPLSPHATLARGYAIVRAQRRCNSRRCDGQPRRRARDRACRRAG